MRKRLPVSRSSIRATVTIRMKKFTTTRILRNSRRSTALGTCAWGSLRRGAGTNTNSILVSGRYFVLSKSAEKTFANSIPQLLVRITLRDKDGKVVKERDNYIRGSRLPVIDAFWSCPWVSPTLECDLFTLVRINKEFDHYLLEVPTDRLKDVTKAEASVVVAKRR